MFYYNLPKLATLYETGNFSCKHRYKYMSLCIKTNYSPTSHVWVRKWRTQGTNNKTEIHLHPFLPVPLPRRLELFQKRDWKQNTTLSSSPTCKNHSKSDHITQGWIFTWVLTWMTAVPKEERQGGTWGFWRHREDDKGTSPKEAKTKLNLNFLHKNSSSPQKVKNRKVCKFLLERQLKDRSPNVNKHQHPARDYLFITLDSTEIIYQSLSSLHPSLWEDHISTAESYNCAFLLCHHFGVPAPYPSKF